MVPAFFAQNYFEAGSLRRIIGSPLPNFDKRNQQREIFAERGASTERGLSRRMSSSTAGPDTAPASG
jgi:hypothetical protein